MPQVNSHYSYGSVHVNSPQRNTAETTQRSDPFAGVQLRVDTLWIRFPSPLEYQRQKRDRARSRLKRRIFWLKKGCRALKRPIIQDVKSKRHQVGE